MISRKDRVLFIISQYEYILEHAETIETLRWTLKELAHYKRLYARISPFSAPKTAERSKDDGYITTD